MSKKFVPFDADVIRKELLSLPVEDHKSLTLAMASYQKDLDSGYRISNYGDGLKMITDSGHGQGRGLFFAETEEGLILLLVYKKETQRAPKSVIETARGRKKRYEQQ